MRGEAVRDVLVKEEEEQFEPSSSSQDQHTGDERWYRRSVLFERMSWAGNLTPGVKLFNEEQQAAIDRADIGGSSRISE